MKLKFLLVIGLFATATTSVFSQEQDFSAPQYAKYGDTPEIRKENIMKYNFFTEAYKLQQYNEAAVYLNQLISTAPKAGANLYIMGRNIYNSKVAGAKTPAERNAYIDTVFTIYDLRIEHFGNSPKQGTSYILNKKAKDAISYIPEDLDRLDEITKAAFDANQGAQDLELIQGYFNLIAENYMVDNIEADYLLDKYEYLSTILDADNSAEKDEAKKVVDALFIQSGAASCENLEKIYKPQFEAAPSNIDLVKKIARYLGQQECAGDFKNTIAEAYYNLEPSAAAAISLATAAQQEENFERAFKYYDEAINQEQDPETKSNYLLRAAGTALISGSARQAADYARNAISAHETNNGVAYFILAQAQGAGLTACSGFDRQAAYWLIVDNLVRARNLLEDGDSTKDKVNEAISSYSAGFPSAEEVFFRTLTPGNSYTVSCGWVSGTTTIREKK
ncbi:MAG: hypothetical protein R3Y26_04545 [Rikenellaceae bacterium]